MSYSQLSICNGALQKIGSARVMNLAEESKEAKACLTEYDNVRKFVLRMYPWGFATKRAILAPDPVAPGFEFEYRFQLPADYLRVVELYDYTGKHRVEGNYLLVDQDVIYLRYIADIEDVSKADPLFVTAFEWYLGYSIARYLTESETVREEAMAGFRGILPIAKFIQSTENSQQELESYDLIDSRYGSGRFVRDPMTS